MKAIGIVAEYNPFHNGHLYQIQEVKKKYPDYAIVVVMSGHFTQRGEVSVIDKWKRCRSALLNGVDLVVELPFPFATQSADFFAYGAITILEKLHCEKVVFGSENDCLDDLFLIAKTQLENEEFDPLVKYYSKQGKNYPTALSCALEDITGKRIDTPNDLLGVSYIKTILKEEYHIQPEIIQRVNNYHDKELSTTFSSATSIREALAQDVSIQGQVPDNTLCFYHHLHFIQDYFHILKYKILTEYDLSIYQTVEEGIDKLLKKEIGKVSSYEEFIQKVKSKRYTYNKISRMLLHILCNFTKEKALLFKDIRYIRILGFNDLGRKYLNSIKKKVDIPIISKILREKDPMLTYELELTQIYDLMQGDCQGMEEGKIIYLGGKND